MADTAEWNEYHGRGKVGETIIKFYDRHIPDEAETLKQGRPISKPKTYIIKLTPGDRLNQVDRPVRAQDKLDYPDQWQAFSENKAQIDQGTPLSEWPLLARSQIADMHALNIFTVEQLAGVSDASGQRIMGFTQIRDAAKKFLEQRDDKDEQIQKQAVLINDLNERLKALESEKEEKRGPGRPRKHG